MKSGRQDQGHPAVYYRERGSSRACKGEEAALDQY